jgi:hypothetical protein
VVFNPLSPALLVTMVGDVLRESAGWERPLDEFQTSQMLSASSVARYLAVELDRGVPELRRFAAVTNLELARAAAAATDAGWREALDAARRQAAEAGDAQAWGTVLVQVLRAARASDDPAAARFRGVAHGLLADLVHREVAMLGRPQAGPGAR